MQYEKDGSLLILGTPRRIILVSETHVLVEGGKSLTIHQAGMYPYSPPATSVLIVQPRMAGKRTMMLQAAKQERLL